MYESPQMAMIGLALRFAGNIPVVPCGPMWEFDHPSDLILTTVSGSSVKRLTASSKDFRETESREQ